MENYSINDVAMITGLSTRTLREYIKNGVLNGEKIDGAWRFTADEVGALFENKAVCQSMKAKRNAIVYDFMLDEHKKNEEMVSVIDIPADGDSANEIGNFFCEKVNECDASGMRLSFEYQGRNARLIIKGPAEQVMKILSEYYSV